MSIVYCQCMVPLDFSPALIAAWLEGTGAAADVAPRIDDPVQREQLHSDYEAVMSRADASTIISVLRLYVRSALPVTRALERSHWTVTGPSAHRSATPSYRRLAAVSVGGTEVLVINESHLGDGHWEQGGFMLVDQAALETQVGPVGDIQRDFGGVITRVPESDELGVVSLGFYDWGGFHTLMSAPRVVSATRHLVLRLLKSADLSGTSTSHSDKHVFELADHLVAVMPGDKPLSVGLRT